MIDDAGLLSSISKSTEKPDFTKYGQHSRPSSPISFRNDSIEASAPRGSMYEQDLAGAQARRSDETPTSEQTMVDQDDIDSMKSALRTSNGKKYEQDLADHRPDNPGIADRPALGKGHMYEQDLGLAQTKLGEDGKTLEHPELSQSVADENDLEFAKHGGIYNEINQGWERGERVGSKATYQVENRLTEDQRKQWLYSPENKGALMDRLKAPEKGPAVVKAVTKKQADGVNRDLYLFPKVSDLYHGQVGGYIADSGAEAMLKNRNIFRLDGNSGGYQTSKPRMQETASGLMEQYPEGLFDPKFNVQKSVKGYEDYAPKKQS